MSLLAIFAGVGLGTLMFGVWLLWQHTDIGFFEILSLLALLISLALASVQ